VAWNYRIMRHVQALPGGEDETTYAIHEVYYEDDGAVDSWTAEPCGSPFGETLSEMVNDLAWISTALAKPVLDFENGKEVGAAPLLEDELLAVIGKEKSH
jgi:hypothetical protein